jgi:predicted transcriptional regulator
MIAFSFFAVAYLHQDNVARTLGVPGVESTQPLVLSVPLMVGIGHYRDYSCLNQTTRMQIYNLVKANPGIHFRGICRELGLPIGVVQYHLGLLTRAGLLSSRRGRRYRRYFESKRFGEIEMKVISLLRCDTAGRILAALLERGSILHKDLANKLDVSSQALSWQMNRLRKTGLIDAVNEGMKVRYLLDQQNAATVKQCLNLIG